MSRRITITILACLAVLWSAAASAQDKINPNQVPNKVTPPPVISNPLIKPPADPTGGGVGERERQALEALRDVEAAGKLEKELGLDHEMGAGPGDDRPPTPGFDKVDETFMQRFCKTKVSRLFPGMCPDSGSGGKIGDFRTETGAYDSSKPGGSMALDLPTAGSGVPSRGGPAGEDLGGGPKGDAIIVDNTPEDGAQHIGWIDGSGRRHDLWLETIDTKRRTTLETVEVRDSHDRNGVLLYRSVEMRDGVDRHVEIRDTTENKNGIYTWRRCRGTACTPGSQPGESGYGQMKARPWFCAQTPEAAGCKPLKSGFEIDPAHPDGEGTPTGTRTTDGAPKVGRGAVSDPGPADSDIRGTTGGGSRPLDMKDPVNPDGPVKPDGRK